MINNVVVVARLAADPRITTCTNQDGSAYNMTSGLLIADMGTKDKPKAVSINFIGFGEGIQKLKKGTKIVVSGELVDNSYIDKNTNQKVYGPNAIKINMWEYAESKSAVDARNAQNSVQATPAAQNAQANLAQTAPNGYMTPQGVPQSAPVPQGVAIPQMPQGYPTAPQNIAMPQPQPQAPVQQPYQPQSVPQPTQVAAPPVGMPNPNDFVIPNNLPFN